MQRYAQETTIASDISGMCQTSRLWTGCDSGLSGLHMFLGVLRLFCCDSCKMTCSNYHLPFFGLSWYTTLPHSIREIFYALSIMSIARSLFLQNLSSSEQYHYTIHENKECAAGDDVYICRHDWQDSSCNRNGGMHTTGCWFQNEMRTYLYVLIFRFLSFL